MGKEQYMITIKHFKSKNLIANALNLTDFENKNTFKVTQKHHVFIFKEETDVFDKELSLDLVISDTAEHRIDVYLYLSGHQKLTCSFIARPKVNSFFIEVYIKAVLEEESYLNIKTDTIVDENITKGYANFQERFLIFDKASLETIPEFSILPAGIEQIHGMVVYSLDDKQGYYLATRGFDKTASTRLLSL